MIGLLPKSVSQGVMLKSLNTGYKSQLSAITLTITLTKRGIK
jgi:hypothetical protein